MRLARAFPSGWPRPNHRRQIKSLIRAMSAKASMMPSHPSPKKNCAGCYRLSQKKCRVGEARRLSRRGNGHAERFCCFEIDLEGNLLTCSIGRWPAWCEGFLDIGCPHSESCPRGRWDRSSAALVPAALICQNGCPNYMNFRMTLKPNPKSRFIQANTEDASA